MLLITIIVPVYNVAPFIDRCIRSIIDQERCEASIECIIIDDCSQDKSMEIVHSHIDNYDGHISFLTIEHPRNKGLSAARNSGIDVAQGDYLFFLDSDDWLPSGSISKFVSIINNYPHIDMVVGNHFCPQKDATSPYTVSEQMLINNVQLRKIMLNYQNDICFAWNKMVNHRLFSDKKNRFPEGIIYEDIYWSYFLFNNIKESIILPDITYIYENNKSSITNTCKKEENITLYLSSYNKIISTIIENPYHDLYPDTYLYLLPILFTNSRLCNELHIYNEDYVTIKGLIKKMIQRNIKDRRLFLATYVSVLLYPPFLLLYRFGWVRRHYDNLDKIAHLITNYLELFHNKPYHNTSGIAAL